MENWFDGLVEGLGELFFVEDEDGRKTFVWNNHMLDYYTVRTDLWDLFIEDTEGVFDEDEADEDDFIEWLSHNLPTVEEYLNRAVAEEGE